MKNSISKNSKIGKNVNLMPFCVIKDNVTIGDNCIIHSGVVVEENVKIGNDVEIFPNSHIGKEPKNPGPLTRKLEFKRTLTIGNQCSIGPGSVIYYEVKIGNKCLIGDNTSIREKVIIGNSTVIGRNCTVNYNTTIGNNTKIMDLTVITGNCTVGNNVFISCLVATTNDKSFGIGDDFDVDKMNGPTIEDDVAIGAGANILHGVIIKNGAKVAAGSLVTKDVEPGNFVMGVPAKVRIR